MSTEMYSFKFFLYIKCYCLNKKKLTHVLHLNNMKIININQNISDSEKKKNKNE